MKIDIDVKNSSVSFVNCCVDLSKQGLYLVTGPNGIGKTTIMKHIVFTDHFENKNRNHFSYVEQDPEKYDVSVKDYLLRYNKNADKQIIKSLICEFGLDYIQMNTSVLKISGGELVKLNIIAALGKNNDFVFLDEPTNNMDLTSVECLIKILSTYMNNKVVVIISHDPRLNGIKHHTIEISKNTVSVKYIDEAPECAKETKSKNLMNYPWQKILARHFLRPLSIVNIVLLLIYAGMFIFINNSAYDMFYDAAEYANRDGSVLIYSVDKEYGELGEALAKSENINIGEDKYYSLIQYDSIPQIVNNYNVENVYIENAIVADQIMDVLRYENGIDDWPIFSVPQVVLGYSNQVNPILSPQYIAGGRYPEDQQGEMVTSQNIIDRYFPGKGIGDTVEWNNSELTIVGIHFLDLMMVSYCPNEANGYFYRYEQTTYDEFVQSQVDFKKKIDAPIGDFYRPDTLVFQTAVSEERSLLLDVFSDFRLIISVHIHMIRIFRITKIPNL